MNHLATEKAKKTTKDGHLIYWKKHYPAIKLTRSTRPNIEVNHSKDSKQIPKYLKAVDKNLKENNIYERIIKLMKLTTRNHQEAEAIDVEITQVTQYGEQQC